jgi:hypothetical protein
MAHTTRKSARAKIPTSSTDPCIVQPCETVVADSPAINRIVIPHRLNGIFVKLIL